MKVSLIVLGVAVSSLVVSVAGCGNDKSSTSSSSSSASSSSASSSSSSTGTSTSPSAQPADYTNLLMKASDIPAGNDAFTMQQPELNPDGKPGVAAAYVNRAGTRRIDDTILVLPSESSASDGLDATKTSSESAVAGATTQPVDVGSRAVTISGTTPDGTKAVTILLFTEGRTLTTLEFSSAAGDVVRPAIVATIGQKQDAAIKAGLPG